MRTQIISNGCLQFQDALYSRFNDFSTNNFIIGRLGTIPVALIDGIVGIIDPLLSAIEKLALTALNLIGPLFSKNYTLRDAVFNAELTLVKIAMTPIAIVLAPIKIVYQFFAILYDPATVNTINFARLNTYNLRRLNNLD
ncbi:MAG: hypothetical protein H0V82_02130 [Candidatus Protochlamydia sp.]|nr:hypothetical protein [Candidatus Protochlamydia sp.]